MAKPTTGRIVPASSPPPPPPDTDQLAVDTLMTSVFSGISLVVATLLFASVGGAGAYFADAAGGAWQAGFGIGLAISAVLAAWVLRHFSDRIRARSANLYRGAWIGGISALAILCVLAYLPQVAFPKYCEPGAACEQAN